LGSAIAGSFRLPSDRPLEGRARLYPEGASRDDFDDRGVRARLLRPDHLDGHEADDVLGGKLNA